MICIKIQYIVSNQLYNRYFHIQLIHSPSNQNSTMEDQQMCDFWFRITPTDIIANGKSKSSQPKSVLIKLGNKQAKCKNIGQSVELTVEVLYSKTLNKYCPIKGIIKVYDINKDGSQMISCVGAFNTEDLLTQNSKTAKLQRDIGPCKVHLTVEVKKLQQQQKQNQPQTKLNQHLIVQHIQSKVHISSKPQIGEQYLLKNMDSKFSKSPRVSEGENQQGPTPYIIDDSADCIHDISVSKCSDVSEDLRRNQKEMIGQELVDQRRKNRILQQKLDKSNIKLQLLRKCLAQRNNEIKAYYQNFRSFTSGLESDQRGQYIFEMNERKRQVSLRYKANLKFKQIFEDFIAFIIKKMNQCGGIVGNDKTVEDETEIQKIITRLQTNELEKKTIMEQSSKIASQLNNLKKQINIKGIELSAKQSLLKKKIQQILLLQQKSRKQMEQKRGLEGLNQYLQERDAQMQIIINTKQNTIQSMRKVLRQNDNEIVALQQKNQKLQRIIDNLQLTIQQLKQQNSNLSETIESYRETFGDLKSTKDKALERQIKECLRWIDQQNRDEELSLQDTTMEQSETAPAMTTIMRSIDQIQNMPLQQISLIRKQVMSVLKRLDEFVAKNSLAGMSP